MNKRRSKIRGSKDLKTHHNRSHNKGSLDENMKALVECMARLAAEEDFAGLGAEPPSIQNKLVESYDTAH